MGGKYFVYIPNPVKKSISNIPFPWRDRVIKALEFLEYDPFYGEKMTGKLTGKRKIRVWPYRILYRIEEGKRIIVVVEVGHRGSMSYK